MTFELVRRSGSVLSVQVAGRDLEWTFYIVNRQGRRFLVPKNIGMGKDRKSETSRLQSEATAFATSEARQRNWID